MQIENSHAPAAFEPIAVPARQAQVAIGVGPTKFYELVDDGEIVSYLDGSRRMVTTNPCVAMWPARSRHPSTSAKSNQSVGQRKQRRPKTTRTRASLRGPVLKVFRFAVETTFYRQPDFSASHRAVTFHKEIATMFNQTQIGPRPKRQRKFFTRPVTPAGRRRRERERLRAKRLQWHFKLAEREANKLRMRAVRARRKGAGDRIAERQAATHERAQ